MRQLYSQGESPVVLTIIHPSIMCTAYLEMVAGGTCTLQNVFSPISLFH